MKSLLLASAVALITTPSLSAVVTAPTFSVIDVTTGENVGRVHVGIYKTGNNGKAATVNVRLVDGTAKAGSDYTTLAGTVTFQPTDNVKFVNIPIINDNVAEPTEAFYFQITPRVNAIVNRGTASVIIKDDDRITCWDGSTIAYGGTCPVQPPPPTVTWTKCADEGGTCYVVGTANVRYGFGNTWTAPRAVTTSILCDNGTFSDPFVGQVKECDTDGTVGTPPAPANTWISAPLQDGGYAIVSATPSTWGRVGPGSGRALVPGELVAIYFNGWGYSAQNQVTYSIYAFSDNASGTALASDLTGVAPVGTPPNLPTDWWIPGLVTAVKTCGDNQHAGQPGIVQGGVYRANLLAGTHYKLATGQIGDAGTQWEVFATDDQNAPDPRTAHVAVNGDCLMGD